MSRADASWHVLLPCEGPPPLPIPAPAFNAMLVRRRMTGSTVEFSPPSGYSRGGASPLRHPALEGMSSIASVARSRPASRHTCH